MPYTLLNPGLVKQIIVLIFSVIASCAFLLRVEEKDWMSAAKWCFGMLGGLALGFHLAPKEIGELPTLAAFIVLIVIEGMGVLAYCYAFRMSSTYGARFLAFLLVCLHLIVIIALVVWRF